MNKNYVDAAASLDIPVIVTSEGAAAFFNPAAAELFPDAAPGAPLRELGFPMPEPGFASICHKNQRAFYVRAVCGGGLLLFDEVTMPMRNLAQFSAAMRMPLSSLFFCGESLTNFVENMESPVLNDNVASMTRSMCRLLKLSNNLRDYSGLVCGDMTLHTARFPADDWIGELLERAEPMLIASERKLEISSGSIRTNLLADRVRLEVALFNLLSNAARSAGPGGVVRLSISRSGGSIIFTIFDNGTLVARDEFLSDTGKFPQRAGESDLYGLGLSLALCRRITELHGGRFLMAAVAGGNVCTMAIPLNNPALEALISDHPAIDEQPPELVYMSDQLPVESFLYF